MAAVAILIPSSSTTTLPHQLRRGLQAKHFQGPYAKALRSLDYTQWQLVEQDEGNALFINSSQPLLLRLWQVCAYICDSQLYLIHNLLLLE